MGLLILFCYQELQGISYRLIYLKSSQERMRILIVSWISKTEEELMSLENALGPCWLQLTPSDWFPIDTDEAWEAVHIDNIHVSPAAQ